MGRSIDLYSFDYEKLVSKILNVCETNDKELVEKILNISGNKVADRYIILNQEFWEEYSCYYNVASVFEKVFKVEDVFSKIFYSRNNDCDKQELVNAVTTYDILDELGIILEDNDE